MSVPTTGNNTESFPASGDLPRQRYHLTVAYDGSAFHGWQKQEPAGKPPLRTVQGELENALVRVLRQPRESIGLLGASRTDAGVHAMGQSCHFDASTRIPLERLCLAINSRLQDDIEARHVEPVADTFDAIRGVVDKQYRYRIWNAVDRPLGVRHLVHHEWDAMDVALMNDAAARLVGTHDVEGFSAAGSWPGDDGAHDPRVPGGGTHARRG